MELSLLDLGRFRPRRMAGPQVFDGPSQVRAYWEALRKGAAIPDRAQLDPRGLGGVLDRVFLAERIAKGLVQVRIAGSALTEIAGTDLRGLPLSCLFTAEARPLLAEALEAVAQGQAVVALDLAQGTARTVAQLLLLPLQDGLNGRVVLGCLGTTGAVQPGKFDILRREEERLGQPASLTNQVPKRAQVDLTVLRRVRHLSLVHTSD